MKKLLALEIHIETDTENEIMQSIEDVLCGYEIYLCNYIDHDSEMLRLGVKDITKREFNKIIKEIEKISDVVKTSISIPPKWHYDTELMKYLAYKIYKEIGKHFEDNKKYYLKSETRKHNMVDYPRTKKEKLVMDQRDWLTMLHHVMNLYGYDYARENMIYNFCSTFIGYNDRVSSLKS